MGRLQRNLRRAPRALVSPISAVASLWSRVTSAIVEATDALHSIETVLRILIMEVLGNDSWLTAPGAPDRSRLEEKQREEAKRRDGVALLSPRLIDYAETYHLTNLIAKSWDRFQPALLDKGRTMAYFGVVEDVRNSIAHNRELVPFERELISGIAGQIRNQVSIYRSAQSAEARYYPLIEEVRDNFGNLGRGHRSKARHDDGRKHFMRLDVGDIIYFEGSAFDARGKGFRWLLRPCTRGWHRAGNRRAIDVAEGDHATFHYRVTEADVGEDFMLQVLIAAKSKYHRYPDPGAESYDDSAEFPYAVSPPDDE